VRIRAMNFIIPYEKNPIKIAIILYLIIFFERVDFSESPLEKI
jgi:hypothetical protein